jgi:hypothetical protein
LALLVMMPACVWAGSFSRHAHRNRVAPVPADAHNNGTPALPDLLSAICRCGCSRPRS